MKILDHNLKAQNQYKHTVKRFKQRHYINITKDQYVSLCAQISGNHAQLVRKVSNRVSIWLIKFRNHEYPVVYDASRKTIATVLMQEWVMYDKTL